MAIVTLSGKEWRFGIAQQATWGTALADSFDYDASDPDLKVAGIQLACDFATVDYDIKVHEMNPNMGTRWPTINDTAHNEYGSMPKIVLTGPVKLNDIDLLMYAFFQRVTESASTPYGSTFVMAADQPADFSVNAGAFFQIVAYSPIASESITMKDCVCSDFMITVEPGGFATYEATMVGRGAVTHTSNPSGTWAVSDNDYLYFENMNKCQNQTDGDDFIPTGSVGVSFSQEVTPIGFDDDTGNHETVALTNYTGTVSMQVLNEGGTVLGDLYTLAAAGSNKQFLVSWGNDTAGSVENDLSMNVRGKVQADLSNVGEDLNSAQFTVQMVAANATVSPVTIITANLLDRGW